MKPILTALCSFGMSGKVFHAPFIDQQPGFTLCAVMERSQKVAAEKYPGIKEYSTIDELLSNNDVELVIVNTPNATHYEYAKKALLAGKHVVVEKPFTVTSTEALELIKLAKQQNKLLSVFQNRRWDSDYLTVKRILEQHLLGDIVEAEIHYDRYNKALSPKLHKETPGPGTGLLYDLGSHLIDQSLQLFGIPLAVFADLDIIRPVSKVPDYMEVLLYYPRLRVRLKASYQVREALQAYVIHGTKGSFLKSRADVQEAMLQSGALPDGDEWGVEPDDEKGLLHTEKGGSIIREYVDSEKGNYGEYYSLLYEAIRNQKDVPVKAEEALDTIRIIEAANKSNQYRKVIEL